MTSSPSGNTLLLQRQLKELRKREWTLEPGQELRVWHYLGLIQGSTHYPFPSPRPCGRLQRRTQG